MRLTSRYLSIPIGAVETVIGASLLTAGLVSLTQSSKLTADFLQLGSIASLLGILALSGGILAKKNPKTSAVLQISSGSITIILIVIASRFFANWGLANFDLGGSR